MNKPGSIRSDAHEQTIRAAWLYYVAGNTQEQTAELLGISRVKVNRLLAEAKEAGIVKISIEHRFARMAEVEETIRSRHRLSFCRTTPPLLSSSVRRRRGMPSRADLNPRARSRVGPLALSRPICCRKGSRLTRAAWLASASAERSRTFQATLGKCLSRRSSLFPQWAHYSIFRGQSVRGCLSFGGKNRRRGAPVAGPVHHEHYSR